MPQRHTIRAGDSLANIAWDNGLLVETIWDHPDNAPLKQQRANPNILMPGDVVTIPDKRDKEAPAPTEKRHRYRMKGIPHVFRIQLFDDDEPRASQPYKLTIRGKGYTKETSGTTDADGVFKALLPPGALEGRLVIDEDEDNDVRELILDILFGSLDPVEELTGVQKRLVNLGFDCPVDGEMSDELTLALQEFQRRFDLPVTGEADDATRDKLASLNDRETTHPDPPDGDPQ